MAPVEDDLGGHVFRRPTERPGLLATSDLFGETKVDLETACRSVTPPPPVLTWLPLPTGLRPAHQFDVAFGVQHEILGLQVPVEDAFTVQVIERLGDAAHAELGSGFFKTPPDIERGLAVAPVVTNAQRRRLLPVSE